MSSKNPLRVLVMTNLYTPKEAATRLRCSLKTLSAHVRSGALRYVQIGRGTKRPRRMYADPDLAEFIERQTRKEVPWSTNRPARRTSISTSGGEVVGFTALQSERTAGKPRR